jgi:hypothetical protein
MTGNISNMYVALSIGCGDGSEFKELYQEGRNNLIIGVEPDKGYYSSAIKSASELEKKLKNTQIKVLNQDPLSDLSGFENRVDLISIIFPYGSSFDALAEDSTYMEKLLSYLKPMGKIEIILHNPHGFEIYKEEDYNNLVINANCLANEGLVKVKIQQIPLKDIHTSWANNFTFNKELPGTADKIEIYKR